MDNKLEDLIKSYEVKSDIESKEQVIAMGSQKMLKNQLKRRSFKALFLSTLQFIRLRTWTIQFIALGASILIATRVGTGDSLQTIMPNLTIIILLSVAFFLDELFKSFTSGMWELEQSFKYDVRQHTLVKMLILGVADMVLIVLTASLTSSGLAVPMVNILFYLLVPYHGICIVSFSLITFWRNRNISLILWLGTGLMMAGILFVTNIFNVYELKPLYWGIAYGASAFLLGTIVYLQAKTLRQEVA